MTIRKRIANLLRMLLDLMRLTQPRLRFGHRVLMMAGKVIKIKFLIVLRLLSLFLIFNGSIAMRIERVEHRGRLRRLELLDWEVRLLLLGCLDDVGEHLRLEGEGVEVLYLGFVLDLALLRILEHAEC